MTAGFAQAQENWPHWRGPHHNGISDSTGLPMKWSLTENIVWKTSIHDRGWSSPVVWGNQIWLTTATEDGKRLFAVCVDRGTGTITHDVKVFDVAEPEHIAPVNSYASPTSVIEEGRVYVHYGTYGTACLSDRGSAFGKSRTVITLSRYLGNASSNIKWPSRVCDTHHLAGGRNVESTWCVSRALLNSEISHENPETRFHVG